MPERPEDHARSLVTEDGTRKWHKRFVGVEYPTNGGPGACIWTGSTEGINKEIFHLTYVANLHPDDEQLLRNTLRFVGNWTAKAEHHRSTTATSYAPTHHHGTCGNNWIGIARYPLPKDYSSPIANWPGWTHLYHEPEKSPIEDVPREEITEQIPAEEVSVPLIEEFFSFVQKYIEKYGYPQSHANLTMEFINTNALARIGFYDNVSYFPWLDPQLVQPQI